MDKEFLSKHKKVFFVSKDMDGFHIAKRPVVYLNEQYTYYVPGGATKQLDHIVTGHIKDVLDLREAERIVTMFCDYSVARFICAYWDVGVGAEERMKLFSPIAEDRKRQEQIIKYRREIELKQAQIRDLQKSIDCLESRFKWTNK